MKIKSLLLSGVLALSAAFFISCDDDLNNVGSSIQPDGDKISVSVDTAYVTARTVSLNDSIYAHTITGLLGKYEDNFFGTVKSDFLSEFFCPEEMDLNFKNNFLELDSVQLSLDFYKFTGDTLAPMGVSVYKANRSLSNNFYTNVDPTKYCDMTEVLGQKTYTISKAKKSTYSTALIRTIVVDFNKQLGLDFQKEALKANNAFQSKEKFREFFPGIYVTTTLGSGNLVNVFNTTLNIHYKYNSKLGNYDGTRDTTLTSVFTLAVTPEVIQLNHVQNSNIDPLLQEGTDALYMKSPAGVSIEMEMPIKKIVERIENNKSVSINSAKLNLKGYTEKEAAINSSFGRPQYVLLIDKDSVQTFFKNKRVPDYKTSFYAAWNSSTNSYSFGNIALLVNEYKNRQLDKDPVFMLFPVEITFNTSTNAAESFYNYLKPAASIIRNGKDELRLELIYSKID